MSDVPDDLTTEGRHRGASPSSDTGRTVRSPTGPDPGSGSAHKIPALFQVMTADGDATADRIRIRTHPPRRVVDDVDDGFEEVAQTSTPDDLSDVLDELPDMKYYMVFETSGDDETETEVLVEERAALDHPWLFENRYDVVTLFPSSEDGAAYAEQVQA